MMTYLLMKIAIWKESLNLDKKMSLGVGEAFFQLLTSVLFSVQTTFIILKIVPAFKACPLQNRKVQFSKRIIIDSLRLSNFQSNNIFQSNVKYLDKVAHHRKLIIIQSVAFKALFKEVCTKNCKTEF